MTTVIIKNVSKGPIGLPLGNGLLVSSGEEVPISVSDFAAIECIVVCKAWIDAGMIVVIGKPTASGVREGAEAQLAQAAEKSVLDGDELRSVTEATAAPADPATAPRRRKAAG